jgi:hypothetical protein
MHHSKAAYQEGTARSFEHEQSVIHECLRQRKRALQAGEDAAPYMRAIRAIAKPCYAQAMTDFVQGKAHRHSDPLLGYELPCAFLGAAELVCESRKVYGVLLMPSVGFVGLPIKLAYQIIERTRGTYNFRGRRLHFGKQAGLDELMLRYPPPRTRVSSGRWEHFKSEAHDPKHYAVYGSIRLLDTRVECALYAALYLPHFGELALRPLDGGDGFFTDVKDRTLGSGKPYSGSRFKPIAVPLPPADCHRVLVAAAQ